MKRKEREKKKDNRIAYYQTLKQEKRLDAYCVKVMAKKGKVIPGIKSLILRMALDEWLDKNENDLDALDKALNI